MNKSIFAVCRRSKTLGAALSAALLLAAVAPGSPAAAQEQRAAKARKGEIAAEKSIEIAQAQVAGKPCYDFFGAGRTSFATVRGSGSGSVVWDIRNNGGAGAINVSFGLVGELTDLLVPGYYDADNIADIAVYRPGNQNDLTGSYYVRPSTAPSTFYGQIWGRSNGDINDISNDFPGYEGDYDGDGRDDVTIVRVAANNNYAWYYLRSRDNTFRAVEFGNFDTDFPIAGADYNGDGRDELTVVRDNTGNTTDVIIAGDSLTSQIVAGAQWGKAETDYYMVGDYIGDQRADFVVWRGEQGGDAVWYIKENGGGGQVATYKWGIAGAVQSADLPVCGDYNGDGKSDVAVYRQSNATFYWINSNSATGGNPPTVGIQQSGEINDLPIGFLKAF